MVVSLKIITLVFQLLRRKQQKDVENQKTLAGGDCMMSYTEYNSTHLLTDWEAQMGKHNIRGHSVES